MREKNKKFIIAFLVGCTCALMLTFLRAQLFNGGIFRVLDLARFLSDGFLTIGVLFTVVYFLIKISSSGLADGVLFIARKCFETLSFGRAKVGSYAKFKTSKVNATRKTYTHLLWSGLACFGLSCICCLWFVWG